MTVDENGKRVSTFDSFLPPELAHKRKGNLFICPNTVTCRLRVDSNDGGLQVLGVYLQSEVDRGDTEYYVAARSEVVLCAGAVATPQILMLRYVSTTS